MPELNIAIDAMGGDNGPSIVIEALERAVSTYPNTHFTVFGHKDQINPLLKQYNLNESTAVSLVHAEQTILMDDKPGQSLRSKPNSSMRLALQALANEQCHAMVCGGNTGALMTNAYFTVKTLPGVLRPALMTAIPNRVGGKSFLLDLGANASCDSDTLFQFGVMGSIHHACIHPEHDKPRVALLNIGEEDMKGLESIKQAAQMLNECEAINYIGFVEGNDLLRDKANVIVCDGFIGNIALKTVEGTASHIAYHVKAVFKSSLMARVLSLFALPILIKLRNKLDNRRYNGASLIGLKGIVIKSHGGADKIAFLNAIVEAVKEVEQDIPSKIHHQIANLLGQESH